MRRRSNLDAMLPIAQPSWLVERDEIGSAVRYCEPLPAGACPKKVMIKSLWRNDQEGWDPDELPGKQPLYFIRRGSERRRVAIEWTDPYESHLRR
jgi:hypothetical protein